jgi:hypothetical protein
MQRVLSQIKKNTLALVLASSAVLFVTQSYGQQGTAVISGMYHTQIFKGEKRFERGYGINYQFFVSDRVALEYNLSYVVAPHNPNYFKLYGGSFLLVNTDRTFLSSYVAGSLGEWYAVVAVLLLVIPDGVSYHIPAGKNITISPYVSALSFDMSEEYDHYNNNLGIRMNMTAFKHLNVAPFAFVQLQHRSRFWGGTRTGFGMGAMLGWKF